MINHDILRYPSSIIVFIIHYVFTCEDILMDSPGSHELPKKGKEQQSMIQPQWTSSTALSAQEQTNICNFFKIACFRTNWSIEP